MLSFFARQDESSPDEKRAMQLSFMNQIVLTVKGEQLCMAALTFPGFKALQLPTFVQEKFSHPFVLPALSLCVPFRQGATLITESRVEAGQVVTYYNGSVKNGLPTNADFVFENVTYPQADAQQVLMRGVLDCNKANFSCFVKGFENLQMVVENAQCGGLGQFIQSVTMQDKGNVALKVVCFTTRGILKSALNVETAVKKGYCMEMATKEDLKDNTVYVLPYFEAKMALEPGTPLTCVHKFREDQELTSTSCLAHVYFLKKSDNNFPYEFPILPMNCNEIQLYEHVFGARYSKVEDLTHVSLKKWLTLAEKQSEKEMGNSQEEEDITTEKRGLEEEDADDEGPVYHQSFTFAFDDPRIVTGVFGTGEGQINIPGAGFDTLTSDFTMPEDAYDTSDCDEVYMTSSDDQAEDFTDEGNAHAKLYSKEKPVAPATEQ